MKALLLCLLLVYPSMAAAAPQASPSPAPERLRIFLDCEDCDFDYIRREVEFVDYVRDRKDADVHILVTTQPTGGGGEEFVFKFIGLGRFAGIEDELKFTSVQTNTDDEERSGYTRILKLGLVRYATSTSVAEHLTLTFRPPRATSAARITPQTDPWNLWSFRVRGGGSVEGEESGGQHSFSASFSADRTTDEWKWNSAVELNFQEDSFTLSDGEEFSDKAHEHEASALLVKSLGDHWSAAVRGRWASTTFLNQDHAIRVGGGFEYSVFPYRESARKELTAQLTVGINSFDYIERTIFGKDEETVGDLLFVAQFDVEQPWGSIDTSFEAGAYLHDLERNRLELDAGLDIRIFKGFSLSVEGSAERIRDQLYLQAGDLTDEEILLRRRQLATGHRYRFSLGFSYTFGSIFNNIVNTRF